MQIDMSRFKVIYGDKVLNALAIQDILYSEEEYPCQGTDKTTFKPKFLIVAAVDSNGCVVTFYDEAWRFQFIPIVERGV